MLGVLYLSYSKTVFRWEDSELFMFQSCINTYVSLEKPVLCILLVCCFWAGFVNILWGDWQLVKQCNRKLLS